MPYLFDVQDILNDTEAPKVIALDFFVLPEGTDVPTLTIILNDVTRNIFKQASHKYSGIKDKVRYYRDKGVGATLNSNPEKFCLMILDVAYKESQGLFEKPSKDGVLALIRKKAKFARLLASKLVEVFEDDDMFRTNEEEDDEKN